ncbi:hypothetical protein JQU17_05580 [Ponticoccus sp. SC2-23]|uniref:hypothetical protein n=1 Tax=Alexandriicola marinus TaxID=2081710 RepID=UPI000FD7892A|nr:hypothetical protein [Alexandriicola marinus]MBM1219661.1 hypothetical protein [Ponticoccus sp. SC6-9]MBM1223267.1 hypothetical protein [Ponticoccus sp. SC6-15]MBM1229474.1 hypothetical protein [Ponticoccus sp. SC6-38]MBM1232233.1 hypothetical protein [Ponticoccus sp. SC6-45]MBM1237817.1 hypothetical protein [Ponticoccus sp. SC6-49]MBM1241244.1 hypothetical protein [Ponticoccus sp. SC2-64]MBM1245757.1 hypothetical protein [Ponticoccus sp. SC6-42]MBM1250235.1 hypothetical protein [Pontico
MKQIAFAFFALGAISVTLGMVWGIQMSATHDHTLSPAHAHLNLVGWVTFAIFGMYYHLVPEAAQSPIAKIHFGLAVLGLAALVPGIVLAINETTETLAIIGSFLTLAAMLVFLFTVFRNRAAA